MGGRCAKRFLLKVKVEYKGSLKWWTNRTNLACSNVAQYGNDGCTLGPFIAGVCCGSIIMPTHGLWKINLVVTKRDELDFSGNPNDYINVRFGSTSRSTALVARCMNSRALGKHSIRHEIEHFVVGSSFAYSFEFSSTNVDETKHLIVECGTYVQQTPPPLELLDEKTQRVLSDYVKMLRLQMKQGEARQAVLLEELIKAEESSCDQWDTSVFNGTRQRFDRKICIALLRAEIQKEIDAQVAGVRELEHEQRLRREQKKREQGKGDSVSAFIESTRVASTQGTFNEETTKRRNAGFIDPTVAQELGADEALRKRQLSAEELAEIKRDEKVAAAKARYIHRKRSANCVSDEEAKTLVNQKVEVYSENLASGDWEPYLIADQNGATMARAW